MSRYNAQVENLHYNAANGSFEAIVGLHEGPDLLKFPVSLTLPIDTDFETVSGALVTRAKAARKRGAQELVSRTRVAARPATPLHPKTLAQNLLAKLNLPGSAQAA